MARKPRINEPGFYHIVNRGVNNSEVFIERADYTIKTIQLHNQTFLKTLREFGDKTPAIFVTSQTSIDDLTSGFESGCCDYIRKPFEMKELLLRVDNVIKARYKSSSKSDITLPLGYRYDASRYKLFKDDKEISLTKKEVKIIELLIKNRGNVIPIEQFSDEIWNHSVLEANVRVQINQLRKKTDKNLIKNIRGLGYTIDSWFIKIYQKNSILLHFCVIYYIDCPTYSISIYLVKNWGGKNQSTAWKEGSTDHTIDGSIWYGLSKIL